MPVCGLTIDSFEWITATIVRYKIHKFRLNLNKNLRNFAHFRAYERRGILLSFPRAISGQQNHPIRLGAIWSFCTKRKQFMNIFRVRRTLFWLDTHTVRHINPHLVEMLRSQTTESIHVHRTHIRIYPCPVSLRWTLCCQHTDEEKVVRF